MLRIQKYLATIGLGGRRDIEALIRAKKVMLNGKTCELGAKIKNGDFIQINNKKYKVKLENLNQKPRILLYNKLLGEVCTTNDEKGRKTVFDTLPKLKIGKWINVGRLDINTSGLLVFTTSGDLANKLMHPSSRIEREYLLKVVGNFTIRKQKQLLEGVQLEDGMAKFKKITPKENSNPEDNKWFKVVILEGRNREVRRMFEAVNLTVSKLMRLRFGKFRLPKSLKKGSFIEVEYESQKN